MEVVDRGMTREDRRALAFHRAIAERIDADPRATVDRARVNLARLRALHPHAAKLLDRWHEWLALEPAELTRKLLDPGPEAREMRHVSPFSGVLSAPERARILQRFRREEQA